jgi:hypothetical protein
MNFPQVLESLLQEVMGMSQPEDFVPIREGRLAEKTNCSESLSAAGRKDEDGSFVGF